MNDQKPSSRSYFMARLRSVPMICALYLSRQRWASSRSWLSRDQCQEFLIERRSRTCCGNDLVLVHKPLTRGRLSSMGLPSRVPLQRTTRIVALQGPVLCHPLWSGHTSQPLIPDPGSAPGMCGTIVSTAPLAAGRP